MRVLFWGTPGFAVPALRALGGAGNRVVGVVTRPDRRRGRGRKRQPSEVRRLAEAEGYSVFTPERPRGDPFEDAIRAVRADISVVVAYGCILAPRILDIPRLGSLNLHASLLPELRGAAPIPRAVERGYAVTGVSVMRMVEAMDAGPVLAQESTPIGGDETASLVSRRLAHTGARLMADVLARLETGPVPEVEQDHDAATFAPKIDRRSARVNWRRDARAVADHIRAMDEVPGAWTLLGGMPVKLFRPVPAKNPPAERAQVGASGEITAAPGETVAVPGEIAAAPGEIAAAPGEIAAAPGEIAAAPGETVAAPGEIVAADPKRGLLVATASGVLRVGEVQPAGKRRMDAAAWLLGRGPRTGDRFE